MIIILRESKVHTIQAIRIKDKINTVFGLFLHKIIFLSFSIKLIYVLRVEGNLVEEEYTSVIVFLIEVSLSLGGY
jgi:hypothetical protein